MQHGIAKIQTRSDSLTFEDERKVKKDIADNGVQMVHEFDVGYLDRSKNISTTTKKVYADETTSCDCIWTDGADNLDLSIPHSKPCNGFSHANNTFHYYDNVSTKQHRKGNELERNRNQNKATTSFFETATTKSITLTHDYIQSMYCAKEQNMQGKAIRISSQQLAHGVAECVCNTSTIAGSNPTSGRKGFEGIYKVKWWRNNITATMEPFEPTHYTRPSSSAFPLDCGLMPSVVSSKTESTISSKVPPTVSSSETGSKNNVYSCVQHEPGVVKYYTTFSPAHKVTGNMKKNVSPNAGETSRNAQLNSFRTLLWKAPRSGLLREQPMSLAPFLEGRYTYTTRHGTTENLYEEVNEHNLRNVPSDNCIAKSTADYMKEEFRRVQHNHFRVLDELNLSLEALIMPHSLENLSPSTANGIGDITENIVAGGISPTQAVITSKTVFPQKPRRYGLLGGDSSSLCSSGQPNEFSRTSLENLSNFQSLEVKNSSHNFSSNRDFYEGDLDSGFSGSGSSSGASYNDSLQNYKSSCPLQMTRNQNCLHSRNTCSPATAPGVFTSKISMASEEDYGSCSVVQIAKGYGQEMSPECFQNAP
ncbi:uncharacterized protein [Eurosta solidaginis]|uniref:uncharacterized protein n=1 Tax=Eurosta solidaginis TaxID=178769 RepID=UPI0035316430